MGKDLQKIYADLAVTSVFIGVWQKPLFQAFARYCETEPSNGAKKRRAYAAFVSEVYQCGGVLTKAVERCVFEDENVYVKALAKGENIPLFIQEAAKRELENFSVFGSLTAEDFACDMGISTDGLPAFEAFNADMGASFMGQNTEKCRMPFSA